MTTRTHLIMASLFATAASCLAQDFRPSIPKAWDDKEVEGFEVPLAQRDRSPRHLSSEEYYKLKVRQIYRSYPAYAKGQEPAGYLESLKEKEPEIIFDPAKLHTGEDWIAAGRLVFEAEILFRPAPANQPAADKTPWPVALDGKLPAFVPGFSYYVRKKGTLEVGINACSGCHTRIMPDGSFLSGAQGVPNFPASEARRRRELDSSPPPPPPPPPDAAVVQRRLNGLWGIFGAPWVMSKEAFGATLTPDLLTSLAAANRQSVFGRQGTSLTHPPHVPSLIGLQDLKYLDSTGLVRNRSIADVMRYAITNQGLDTLAHFGDFQPISGVTPFSGELGTRYSDEQLYALALYVYSLKPPTNPNPVDSSARRGEKIFHKQACSGCHPAPFYTNNQLTPAIGFKVPDDLRKTDAIMNVSVGTDPTAAMQTRRGTGFYKVPSLRGVWYRTSFGHGGWAETLEEWLDPERLKEDYVPKGYHLGPGPIKGHEFGLKLTPKDKQDLIAFLKTL